MNNSTEERITDAGQVIRKVYSVSYQARRRGDEVMVYCKAVVVEQIEEKRDDIAPRPIYKSPASVHGQNRYEQV